MRSSFKALVVTAASTATLVGGGLASSAAAAPIAVGNLVNVQIDNVLNNNDVAVAVPINVAANICDVNVVVLATDLADDGEANCTARNGSDVTITQP